MTTEWLQRTCHALAAVLSCIEALLHDLVPWQLLCSGPSCMHAANTAYDRLPASTEPLSALSNRMPAPSKSCQSTFSAATPLTSRWRPCMPCTTCVSSAPPARKLQPWPALSLCWSSWPAPPLTMLSPLPPPPFKRLCRVPHRPLELTQPPAVPVVMMSPLCLAEGRTPCGPLQYPYCVGWLTPHTVLGMSCGRTMWWHCCWICSRRRSVASV